MAREVLDVQKYPDLRQYPGGPPLRPYDAAGWTLPLQMGVEIAYASKPLDRRRPGEAERCSAPAPDRRPARRPTTWRRPATRRRSTACPASASIRARPRRPSCPPAGTPRPAPAPRSCSIPAQNNAYRALNAAWKQGASVTVVPGPPAGRRRRFVVSGLAEAAQADLVKSLALVAERAAVARRAAARSRGSDCSSPGAAAWTRDGRAGCSSSTASTSSTLHPEDFKTPIGDRVDVLILADDARIPVEAAAAGGARGEGGMRGATGARAGRRAGAAQPPAGAGRRRPRRAARARVRADRGRPPGARGVRPRRRDARLPQQRHPVCDPAVQAAGEERRRKDCARGLLPARLDRRGAGRHDAPGDGGHAGSAPRSSWTAARCSSPARGIQGDGPGGLRRTAGRRCCRAT